MDINDVEDSSFVSIFINELITDIVDYEIFLMILLPLLVIFFEFTIMCLILYELFQYAMAYVVHQMNFENDESMTFVTD